MISGPPGHSETTFGLTQAMRFRLKISRCAWILVNLHRSFESFTQILGWIWQLNRERRNTHKRRQSIKHSFGLGTNLGSLSRMPDNKFRKPSHLSLASPRTFWDKMLLERTVFRRIAKLPAKFDQHFGSTQIFGNEKGYNRPQHLGIERCLWHVGQHFHIHFEVITQTRITQ